MIIPAIALAASLTLTTPVPGPVLLGGHTTDSRETALERGSRAYPGLLRAAATPPAPWAQFVRCVIPRESHGNPAALNPASGAMGLAQFLPSWLHGLPYVTARRLLAVGFPAPLVREIRRELSTHRINHWPAPFQLAAFTQVLVEGGWEHWNGPGCNHLVPAT